MRFDATGRLDDSFAEGGILDLDLGYQDGLGEMIVDTRGRIVVLGGWTDDTRTGPKSESFIARLLPNGSLDPGFSPGGLWLSPFANLEGDRIDVYDMVFESDHVLWLAGHIRSDGELPEGGTARAYTAFVTRVLLP